ncbi:YXWGXW repeat-containing protein [Roseateles sp. YR242]|uniref:YXWGXW repeat-containing protein n=1 Tax=Roseateles sp. YR242 TaxID=1855305 RepID=UPI0008C67672|nr:YXWGXW repeat-containing protein [Roseateles sp. YR242]SEL58233.1 YXWGXW repeat-containing protein [Roseateles sp. YR242]
MRALRIVVYAIAAPLLASALSGCIVLPPGHYHGGGGGYGGGPRGGGYGGGYSSGYGQAYEPAAAGPPTAGFIWIEGFWDWRGGRRTWVDGHWGPPRR